MQPDDFATDVLQRLPLAEAVLLLWQWQADDPVLDHLFQDQRQAAYTKQLRFATLVHLLADALLEHGGSGRQSFQRGQERGELTVSIQAAYQKLGRLPLAVSEAFLATSTQRLLQLLPPGQAADTPLPQSLRTFDVMAVDGKVIKGVPKRLRPLRPSPGGVLGGKALVAWHLSSGLAVAMASDADGQTNETKLLPQLLPQVRPHFAAVLWLADRQFGNPAQAAAFTARASDRFVVRHDGKTAFAADPDRPVQRGQDGRGRTYEQDWGVLGGPANKQPRYVRRIRLDRPDAEPIVLVTDLLDAQAYPAADLLELYLTRWGIERVSTDYRGLPLAAADRHHAARHGVPVGVLLAVVQPDSGGAGLCGRGGAAAGAERVVGVVVRGCAAATDRPARTAARGGDRGVVDAAVERCGLASASWGVVAWGLDGSLEKGARQEGRRSASQDLQA